uniref:restriction endonuclease subunit S n=1 Tax=Lactococcus sp. TaxID=44273 RepID=UPI003242BBCA
MKERLKAPELRFPGFTDDWEERKLGDTETHFTDGNYGESYPSAKDMSDKANGIPFLRGSDFSNGYLDSSNANYIKPEKHAELTSGHIKQDDIVLAVRGSLGTLGYATKENEGWNINSQLAILRTNKSEISGMFLIQYLLGSKGQKEIFSRNTGTALKQLPIKQLKDIPVPVPTLLEQQKIGSFFKKLDDTIDLHQRKLDLLKEQKKGYLQKMFPKNGSKVPELRFAGFADDWEERKLGEISKTTIGEFVIKTKQSDESPYPVYNGGRSYTGKYDEYNNDGPKIVISARGANAGFVNYVSGRYWAGNSCYSVSVTKEDEFSIGYLYQFIKYNQVLFTAYQQAANIPSVSKSDVEKFSIKYPTVLEQKKIESFFKQLDNTITLHQFKLDLLKEQKKGFLQKMFV